MTKSYWKPQGRSSIMALAAVLSLLAVGTVEFFPAQANSTGVNEKLVAATLAGEAFETIKSERIERGIEIDPATDPAQSGLVGQLISPVTSNHGDLSAKQATINPNFAAVVLEMLKQAGVGKGDVVAVGFSGSFPALNISVLAAMDTLGAKPIVISSASGSQWGANHPDLLWIDMESALNEAGIFQTRSVAASLGGVEDRGIGMSEEQVKLLRAAIARNELPALEPADFTQGINERMLIYRRHADGASIKAYINVGGGAASVGTHEGKKQFDPGLNLTPPVGVKLDDSVMARFAHEDVPVIHLVQIEELAMRYGLPLQIADVPKVGEGNIYAPEEYNTALAAGGLLAIVLVLALPGLLNSFGRINPNIIRSAVFPERVNGKLPRNGHIFEPKPHPQPAIDGEPIL